MERFAYVQGGLLDKRSDGGWVRYSDHLAAIEEQKRRVEALEAHINSACEELGRLASESSVTAAATTGSFQVVYRHREGAFQLLRTSSPESVEEEQ